VPARQAPASQGGTIGEQMRGAGGRRSSLRPWCNGHFIFSLPRKGQTNWFHAMMKVMMASAVIILR
tara:strand:- start:86 stop:283 length:198 start_codon:yes stop_codon:yes gene_type:complete